MKRRSSSTGEGGVRGNGGSPPPPSSATVEPGVAAQGPIHDAPDRVISTRLGRRDALTRRLLAVADVAGITFAFALALILAGEREQREELLLLFIATLPVWLLLFKLYGLYDRDIKRISHSTVDDLPWIFHALVVGGLLMWAYFKVLPLEDAHYPSTLVLSESILFGLLGLLLVSALRSAARRFALNTLGAERVLVAGGDRMIDPLLRKIAKHPEYGLHPVGLISPSKPHDDLGETLGVPIIGGATDFRRLARERAIERLVVCKQDFSEEEVLEMIQVCRSLCVKVSLLPHVVDALGPSVEIDEVEGVTVLGVNPPILSRTSRLIKRGFDLIVAATLLFLAAPLLAVIAVAIRLDSSGSALFRQPRVGRNGEVFELLKFRTMDADAESRRAELLADSLDPNWLQLADDPRVTRVGRFLRTSSLDELPQLWNVIRGEMSLVGPRPLPLDEDRRIAGWMRGRLDLMPGITGLWQVLGRTRIPFDEMVKLDYLYVANWSLWFDIRLLIRTLPTIFSRRGAG